MTILNHSIPAFPRPQQKLSPQSARFSTTQANPDFEMQQLVQLSHPESVTQAFYQTVKTATQEVLKTLPKQLCTAISEQGYRVLVTPAPGEHIQDLAEMASPHRRRYLIKQHLQDLKNPLYLKHYLQEEQLYFPETPLLQTFLKTHSAFQIPVELVESLLLRQLKRQLALESDIGYHRAPQTIIVPEKAPLVLDSWWNQLAKTVGNLERLIRHESWHFVDHVLGRRLLGRHFSKSCGFRTAVLSDIAQAKAQSQLPHPNTKTFIDSFFKEYFPISPDISPYSFEEAYAEVGSSFSGGGICDRDTTHQAFPTARRWIKAHLFPLNHCFNDKPLVKQG